MFERLGRDAHGRKRDPVLLRLVGSMAYSVFETPEGYSVVSDGEGGYCYAMLVNGEFQSTGVCVTQQPPIDLAPGLREAPEVVQRKINGERRQPPSQAARAAAMAAPEARTLAPQNGLLEGNLTATGNVDTLVVLVTFQDEDLAADITRNDLEDLYNGVNPVAGNSMSVREYYRTVSGGQLSLTAHFVGPIQLPRDKLYYDNNDGVLVSTVLRMLTDPAKGPQLISDDDWRKLDYKGRGYVANINILYAGAMIQSTAGGLWPHNWYAPAGIPKRLGIGFNQYLLTDVGASYSSLSIGQFMVQQQRQRRQ